MAAGLGMARGEALQGAKDRAFPNNMGASGQALVTNRTTGTSWETVMKVNTNNGIANYTDDTAAAAGGVVIGGIYRTGNDLKVRLA